MKESIGWMLSALMASTSSIALADSKHWGGYKSSDRYEKSHHGYKDRDDVYRYKYKDDDYEYKYKYKDGRYEYKYKDKDEKYEYRSEGRAPYWSHGDRGNHYGHRVKYKRGDYIPYEYRHSKYYVSDWRYHHLYEPPRGYRWMWIGGDYLLVSTSNFSVRLVF